MENFEFKKAIRRLKRIKNLSVSGFMQRNVITLDANDLLATAARTFIENKINGIVIMKDEKPYSLLTSWDLLHQSYLESFSDKMDYLKTPLGDLIDNPILYQLKPSDSIEDVADTMARNKIKTIAIVENDELVGIVSITDLVKIYHHLILDGGNMRNFSHDSSS